MALCKTLPFPLLMHWRLVPSSCSSLSTFDCGQITLSKLLNSLRPRRNGRYNANDIFKCIFLKENVWIPTKISLKFVPKGPNNNFPALVQILAWRRPGDKPLSEPMMVSLLTHICITRPNEINNWNRFVRNFLYRRKCLHIKPIVWKRSPFQWIAQRQLQDDTRNNLVVWFWFHLQ